MRVAHLIQPTLLLCLATACSEGVSPNVPGMVDGRMGGAGQTSGGAGRIVVMTQNMYVGADVDAVIGALLSPSPDDDLPALQAAIATLQRTDFPSRAAALAEEIERYRPHVVGLQEISVIRIGALELQFLPVLLQAIQARGLTYQVAAQVQNIDATPATGVQLIDYDVLLVDTERVTVNSSIEENFAQNVGPITPTVSLLRGYVGANVTIGGEDYTIVSTHPEPNFEGLPVNFPLLRAAQIGEIVAALGGTAPAIVMGDLNDHPGSPMYQVLTGAGFTDVWAEFRPGVVGFTCCHETDLSDQRPQFDERIDYVFVRGFEHGNRAALGQVIPFGVQPSDRTDGPLGKIWISDHAGLVVTLLMPRGPAR
jgi:endonuclease/exonuclease/phosphatase family metal-dependent hydrolase